MDSELEYVLNELAQYNLFGNNKSKSKYKKEAIYIPKEDKPIRELYNKFKKIEIDGYRKEDEEIFYEQAKLTENFECNYEYKKMHRDSYDLFRYCGSYEGFSFNDFKTYFSWRTKIRKGQFEKTDFEYEHIYINEIINQIGCKSEDDAIEKLITFWKEYRKFSTDIDYEMQNIIKEFYIISDISTKYEYIVEKFPIKIKSNSKDFKDINKGIYKDKIEFLSEISSYKIAKSKLLETKYANVLSECIEQVFLRLDKELEEKNISLPNMLIHKGMKEHWWEPLSDYLVYKKPREKWIILQGTEKYEYKYGSWSRTRYVAQANYKYTIGYILKTMECYIREYLEYRKLKAPSKGDILFDYNYWYGKEREIITTIYKMELNSIIQSEVIKYLSSQKIPRDVFAKKKQDEYVEPEEKIEIKFNQEEFAKIRKKSEEIQKALIVDEEQETTVKEEKNAENENKKDSINVKEQEIKQVAESFEQKVLNEESMSVQMITNEESTSSQTIANEGLMSTQIKTNEDLVLAQTISNEETNVFKEFTYNLTDPEKEILQVLLQKENVENKMFQIAQSQNEMLEVMVSNINDKALETIGDTIIESDMASIYEDYENEIKQVL